MPFKTGGKITASAALPKKVSSSIIFEINFPIVLDESWPVALPWLLPSLWNLRLSLLNGSGSDCWGARAKPSTSVWTLCTQTKQQLPRSKDNYFFIFCHFLSSVDSGWCINNYRNFFNFHVMVTFLFSVLYPMMVL